MDEEIKKEVERCLNCKTKPCMKGCPLNNDIPEIIRLIKLNKCEQAYDLLTKTTVLSVACGKVCPHSKQCQGKCTRGISGKPIEIGKIEEWLAELAIEQKWKIKKFPSYEENKKKNIKVAVIGGGPAGLTCAAFLARNGINVKIFEKHNQLGGLLSHGIPDFRLNKLLLNKSISKILDLGIEVQYNKELNENLFMEELLKEFDSVFLAIGSNISIKMNIEGERLSGVYGANELLEYPQKANYKSKNIIVIGGGNVAIDVARTAKRKGANSVKVVYRRSEKEMPAESYEIAEAKLDGVKFIYQNNVVKILDSQNKSGQVNAVECVKTELIKKEGEVRDIPVNIEGSNYKMPADMVIMAIGSKIDEDAIKNNNFKLRKNYIYVDENNMTSIKNVYAIGDLIGVKSTVAWASRSGRNVAEKFSQ